MGNITKHDLQRQTNYIIVNSHSKKSYNDSKELAELYLKKDNRYRVLYLAPEDMKIEGIKVKAIGSAKRNRINTVDSDGRNLNQYFAEILHYMKFGMLIISNQNLNSGDFSLFKTPMFKKKSIDVIKHQAGLNLSKPEIDMLKKSIEQAKNGDKITQNFAFRIYPNPEFEFNKTKIIELKKQHEIIDVIGLMLTQYCVNSETAIVQKDIFDKTGGNLDLVNIKITKEYTEKYAYYSYFSREIIGVNKNTIAAGIAYFTQVLNLSDDILNYAKKIWLGINTSKTEKIKEIKEELSVFDKAIDNTVEKMLTGKVVILTEADANLFIKKEYNNFIKENPSSKISFDNYASKSQDLIQKGLEKLGVDISQYL